MTFAKTAEYNGIHMTKIGQWSDIAAYYRGEDGNAWTYNHCTRSWANQGNYIPFVESFSERMRGVLTLSEG